MEDKKPFGSEPVRSEEDNSYVEPEAQVQPEPEAAPEPESAPKEDKPNDYAKLEKMLKDSQSMIGKQSSEIGQLRSQLEQHGKPSAPEDDADMVAKIQNQMDEGEISISDGLRQILSINSNLTAKQVMSELSKQRQEEETAKQQQEFFEKNPDYMQVIESGELNQYMQDDPMADEYVAYTRWKADQEIKALRDEYEKKVQEAKEEGAKLAKGSEAAGKVLSKQGVPPVSTSPQKPFKNRQEAADAMLAKLKELRSA